LHLVRGTLLPGDVNVWSRIQRADFPFIGPIFTAIIAFEGFKTFFDCVDCDVTATNSNPVISSAMNPFDVFHSSIQFAVPNVNVLLFTSRTLEMTDFLTNDRAMQAHAEIAHAIPA
jgi:hypothetical protein